MRKAFDKNVQTVWRTEGLKTFTVDLGRDAEITGFSYTPAQDDNLAGTIYKYRFKSVWMARIGKVLYAECELRYAQSVSSDEFSPVGTL